MNNLALDLRQKHEFIGHRQYIPGEPDEWISYCKHCGAEYMDECQESEFCPEEREESK